METINQRIDAVLKTSGLTKTAFADRIKVGQPFVSKLTSGASAPSDRTIRDICEAFNVNETWLRTGEGDMFNEVTRDEQIADFVGDVLRERDDSFKRRFVSMMSRLDADGWAALEKMANDLVAEREKKD
mgnify:FL=1